MFDLLLSFVCFKEHIFNNEWITETSQGYSFLIRF